jgi:signal recognition particle subunit SRP14
MPVIVRASNGKSKRDRPNKVKLSTVVQPDELDNFYVRYAEVCKAGMTALKPRDRSKKKAKAKKKKAAA